MELTYQTFIQNILDTRGRFACGDEYHERHHIVPRCMNGTNDESNLIDLFAKDHFEAHRLLVQENQDNKSLVFAWTCMAFPKNKYEQRCRISPEEYEEARKAISTVMSGRKLSDETKKKLSIAKTGQPCSEKSKLRTSETHKGVPFSEEHKKKISESLMGRVFSDEHKANISKGKCGKPLSDAQKYALAVVSKMNKGRKHSEESRAKISAGNKGKIVSKESREKMSKAKKGKKPATMIRVAQYDFNSGCLIKEWECIMDASRATGIDNSSIAKCARGKRAHAGGFLWKFI